MLCKALARWFKFWRISKSYSDEKKKDILSQARIWTSEISKVQMNMEKFWNDDQGLPGDWNLGYECICVSNFWEFKRAEYI